MAAYEEPVALGAEIRRERTRRGLTQKALAIELDVAQPTVARWEKGRRPEPEFFDRIAGFLNKGRDVVIRLAHEPAEVDELEELVAAMGGRWHELEPDERKRLAARVRKLLEP